LSCSNFFSNMTSSAPFRSCRPFSMLFGSSTEFINVRWSIFMFSTSCSLF
jgi:hypothetical protein